MVLQALVMIIYFCFNHFLFYCILHMYIINITLLDFTYFTLKVLAKYMHKGFV